MNNTEQNSYRVFTIASGKITAGAAIETIRLKGAGIDLPVVMVGEEGRGRERGVVPVGNPPMVSCPERDKDVWTSSEKCEKSGVVLGEKKDSGYTRNHPDQGQVRGRLMFAEVGETNAGKPKFFTKSDATNDDFVIVVFDTKIGFRGSNAHTGDRSGWKCSKYGCDAAGEGAFNAPSSCPKCGANGYDGPKLIFAPFPGKIIVRGHIAQGDAGRAGGGEQLITLVPKDVVFRTAYSGRLYGAPGSHYYKWDGSKFLAATWDERISADLF